MNKAAKLLLAVVLIFVTLGYAGCGKKDNNANVEQKNISVTVSEAKKQEISAKTVITGKITPLSEVVIVPKISGKAAEVPVDVSTRVKKGDLLVKLDTTDLEISLSGAVLNYTNAKSNYERMKSLYSEGGVSKEHLEQAELAYSLAKNQTESIRNQISNATITSPIDGEVAGRSIDPGEMATPGQPVMTVVNIDKVCVEGAVAERDIALVNEGQNVKVRIDSAGGTFEGVIQTLSPVADAMTKGYPVKVEINNPGHKLKPGMFAEIELVTGSTADAIVVPKEALVTRGADKVLYVIKGDLVEERRVKTGIESEDRVEITSGLAAGEKFVIEGQQSLFNQAKVTVRTGAGS